MKNVNKKVPKISKEFNKIFEAGWLRRKAKEMGAMVRYREVDIVTLFWTLILAPQIGADKSIAGLNRLFNAMGKVTLVTSAFLNRFSDGCVKFMQACMIHAIQRVQIDYIVPKIFKYFKEVLSIDSTVITLADTLANIFPGCRTTTKPAALKVNAVHRVVSHTTKKIQIAKETKSETKFLSIGAWVKSKLLLFDLGYYSYVIFERIDDYKGYFISRLKSISNQEIKVDNLGTHGHLIGKKLQTVFSQYHGDEVDFMISVHCTDRNRKNPMKRITNRSQIMLRVVGVWNEEKNRYYSYITNIGQEIMTTQKIASAYATRWLVEMLFSELKHRYGMKGFPSCQRNVILILIYAAIIQLLLSRVAINTLRHRMMIESKKNKRVLNDEELNFFVHKRTPYLRFASVFSLFGLLLLPEILKEANISWDANHIETLLLHASIDPNVNRKSSAFSRRFNA